MACGCEGTVVAFWQVMFGGWNSDWRLECVVGTMTRGGTCSTYRVFKNGYKIYLMHLEQEKNILDLPYQGGYY